MSLRAWFRAPRVRRGIAAGAVVLSAGGLVLARTPASAAGAVATIAAGAPFTAGFTNAASFSGPGVHGSLALSHGLVLAGAEQRVFAELDLKADAVEKSGRARAPLAMAIVLDTSGSMAGEKIEQAKQAVIHLVRDLRDDDEVAFLRYSSDVELVQPLARAGAAREGLVSRVRAIQADGGTSIAPALAAGLRALSDASKGRVRRVVLASDGLDGTRAQSEANARDGAARGVTVSAMGIGLDFDEGYMGGVAQAGHGNFAFVNDEAALATFLRRELEETAATTVESATARIKLPAGLRFVRAIGAEARPLGDGGEVELALGSLFAGDERRVILELGARLDAGEARAIEGVISWSNVGGDTAQARFAGLSLTGSADPRAVDEARAGAVLAKATSAVASLRQLEAAKAYGEGDARRAQALIDQNVVDLAAAAPCAPAAEAASLQKQATAYTQTRGAFAAASPKSAAGSRASKSAVEKDMSNIGRQAAF